MSKKLFICILAVLIVGRITLAEESKDINALQVTFTMDKPEYILCEPILLRCDIINQSDAEILVDLGLDKRGAFLFSPETESEKIITKEPIQLGGFHIRGKIRIKPMSSFKHPIILDEWLIFTESGLYRIKCSLRIKDKILGNVLSIKVNPSDSEKLRAIADSMLEIIEKKTGDWQERYFLPKAMSFFRSPVVIPQLKKAVELGNYEVIKAFRRIGGGEAMESLREFSNNSSAELSIRAKQELIRLQRGDKN